MKENKKIIFASIVVLIVFVFFQYMRINENEGNINQEKETMEKEETLPASKDRPKRFQSEEAKKIKNIIPEVAFLRDYAPLDGIDGYLALYILEPKLGPQLPQGWLYLSCPNSYYGQVIEGNYWLALIQDWEITNEIPILFPDFDNWPTYESEDSDHGFYLLNDPNGVWKEDGGLKFRQMRGVLENWDEEQRRDPDLTKKRTEIIESTQLVLEDLTGDGIANEVRFQIEYISCGNNYYTIAGYNAETNKVMIYKINDGEYSHIAFDDFKPNEKGLVIHNTGCDHGRMMNDTSLFRFDFGDKEYVKMCSTGFVDCAIYFPEYYK